MIYTTVDGDVLDAICHNHYGKTAGVTELVLSHNPGLADYGSVYEAGLKIELPEITDPIEEQQTVKLWD